MIAAKARLEGSRAWHYWLAQDGLAVLEDMEAMGGFEAETLITVPIPPCDKPGVFPDKEGALLEEARRFPDFETAAASVAVGRSKAYSLGSAEE